MAPPDLKDPVQRAAYQRELSGVAAGLRRSGILLALVGAGVALVRLYLWPAMPVWVPGGLIGVGVMAVVSALAARSKYHQLRMRGQG